MKQRLILVKISSDYCDFLRTFDKRVPYNYAKKAKRPFVGVLFQIDKYHYFAPLSSPKPKHLKMHNTIDFLKLDGGKLGAVNFNNMLPVTTKNITKIDFDRISNNSDRAYYKLLQEQIYWLNRNRDQLYKKSFQLYQKQIANRLPNSIMQRCCNFKLLEEKCTEYNQDKMKITN